MNTAPITKPDTQVRCAIEQNIASFALRDLFHPQATIAISWYRGPIEGFIKASRSLASPTKHWLGAPRIQVRGERALSEVDVAIMVRSKSGRWKLM